jgi:hypothetical protein
MQQPCQHLDPIRLPSRPPPISRWGPRPSASTTLTGLCLRLPPIAFYSLAYRLLQLSHVCFYDYHVSTFTIPASVYAASTPPLRHIVHICFHQVRIGTALPFPVITIARMSIIFTTTQEADSCTLSDVGTMLHRRLNYASSRHLW